MPSANSVVVETPPPSSKAVVVPIVVVVVGVAVRAPVANSKEVVEDPPPPNTKAVVTPIVGVVATTGAVKVAKEVGNRLTVSAGATVGTVGVTPKVDNNNEEEDTPGVPKGFGTPGVRTPKTLA